MKALLVEQSSVHEPAGLMVMARLGNVAVGMATIPALIHFLGPRDFAAWALLLAMSFAFVGLEIGMALTFVKHAAPLLQGRELHAAREVKSSALVVLAVVFSLAALPVITLAPWAARELELPDGATLGAGGKIVFVYFAVAVRSLMQFGSHGLTAARRFRAVATVVFLQSTAGNVASAVCAAWTRRLDLALLAFWSAQCFVAACGFAFSLRLFEGGGKGGGPTLATAKELMPHGLKIQLGEWAQIVTFQFDKFIIANWLGLLSVAAYEVANRCMLALRSIPVAGLDSFLPSAAIDQSAPEEVWQRYLSVTRLAASAVSVFMLAPLTIAPLFLYAWTGHVGYDARGAFAGLFLGFAANVLALPAAAMVQAAGRADLQARAAMLTLVVNVPLSLTLLWQFGMGGAAIGTSLAMMGGALVLVASMHRAYGRPPAATLSMLAAYWPVLLACALIAIAAWVPFARWFGEVPEALRDSWRLRLPLAGVAIGGYLLIAALLLVLQFRCGLLTRAQYEQLRDWLQRKGLLSPR